MVPVASDGSYMVFERIDYQEAKRRAPEAAEAMRQARLKSLATLGLVLEEEDEASWG